MQSGCNSHLPSERKKTSMEIKKKSHGKKCRQFRFSIWKETPQTQVFSMGPIVQSVQNHLFFARCWGFAGFVRIRHVLTPSIHGWMVEAFLPSSCPAASCAPLRHWNPRRPLLALPPTSLVSTVWSSVLTLVSVDDVSV